jgi:hypothetical protein
LIKLLIDLHAANGQALSTPVVGASGVTDPTSQDVHLYLDPVTEISEAPIFYADCESLLGGEREPISADYDEQPTNHRRQLRRRLLRSPSAS